jgi:hypothetical protein
MNYLGLLSPFVVLTLYFSYTGHAVFAIVSFIVMDVLGLVEILVSHRPRATFTSSTFADADVLDFKQGAKPTARDLS